MDRHNCSNMTKGIFLLLLLLTACSAHPPATSSPKAPKPAPSQVAFIPSPPAVPKTCQPTPFASSKIGPEAQGKATNAEVWALFFADPHSISVGQEVKIVWRMTGSGDLHVVARHAGDMQVQPSWGPEEHRGSNWSHPGDEWGTGFKFSSAGCWNLHVTRKQAAGDLWIMVKK